MRLMLWLAAFLTLNAQEPSARIFTFQEASAGAAAQAQGAQSSKIWIGRYAEFEEFLRTATIERTGATPVGVLAPRHAYFTPGGLAEGAAVKNVQPGKRNGFFESYKSEIAAYKLDRLLELNMVPPTGERRFDGQMVSVQLWVKNTRMLSEIRKLGLHDPDAARWNRQLHRVQVFDDLVGNIDENAGNLLFDAVWNFIKIDHSRAFTNVLNLPFDLKNTVRQIDRPFFNRLKALDRKATQREVGAFLTENDALPSLFRRRDAIVKTFEELAKQNGEAKVFEEWPE